VYSDAVVHAQAYLQGYLSASADVMVRVLVDALAITVMA
jgi:hypothetical protein